MTHTRRGRLLRWVLWLGAILTVSCAGADQGEVKVTLLHVNDVYQAVPVDGGQVGGIARLATLKQRLRAVSPHTLLMLGGDTLSPSVASNLLQGKQMIAAWNAATLDLAVYGNHEFDFGPDVLAQRVKESAFPWLASNVIDRRTGEPFAGARRYVIHTYSGVKVGFIGLLTPSTHVTSLPGPNAIFLDPIDTAIKLYRELNEQGIHTVVALTHQTMGADKALARAVPLDIILGGHEHEQLYAHSGRSPILKVGSDARFAGRVDLHISRSNGKVNSIDWAILPVDEAIPLDATTSAAIEKYERQLNDTLGLPVGRTRIALDARQENNRRQETNLANLITDAFRAHTKADVALINGGSVRSNSTYGPGPLTRKDILSILPFENPIVKVEITGRVLRLAIEYGLARIAEDREDGRFPQVSGMQFRYDPRRPPGSRVLAIAVHGKPLIDDRVYTLTTSTYLLNGGDGYAMLKDLKLLLAPEDASVAATVLMDYIGGREIAPATDGRIVSTDK